MSLRQLCIKMPRICLSLSLALRTLPDNTAERRQPTNQRTKQTNKAIWISYVTYVRMPYAHIYRPHSYQDQQYMTNTYVLVVKGFLCPSRNSSSPGNNLHCVSGYRSRHSNTVCPGWERSSRLADQGSTYWLDLHSTNPAGLNSRALHLLPSVSAVLQS